MIIVEPVLRKAMFKLLDLHLSLHPDALDHAVIRECLIILGTREMDRPKIDALLAPYTELASLLT